MSRPLNFSAVSTATAMARPEEQVFGRDINPSVGVAFLDDLRHPQTARSADGNALYFCHRRIRLVAHNQPCGRARKTRQVVLRIKIALLIGVGIPVPTIRVYLFPPDDDLIAKVQ